MAATDEVTRYRFGPLERRGLIAGWRGGQIASVAAALLVGVGILRAMPDPPGLAAVVAVLGVGLMVACWPIRGRTIEQWAPLVFRFVVAGSTGRKRCMAVPTSVRGGRDVMASEAPPTGPLRGLSLLEPSVGRGDLRAGIVVDRRARCYTAVLAVRGGSFALLEHAEQARRVAGWAGVLAGLAREGSVIHRLQWVERSLPDDGRGMEGYLADELALHPSAPQVLSYRRLLGGAAPVTQRHEIFVAVSVRGARRGGQLPHAGASSSLSDAGACSLLVRELSGLERQLESAEIEVEGALSRRSLAHALYQAVAERPRVLEGAGGPSWPWPTATEARWSCLRADGTWHATYWVVEWPRVDVGPDFLSPLLLQTPARRSLGVTMEPVSPLRAAREAEHARTADLADAELRRRGGFMRTARRRREEEVVARRETELADGHAQYRFSAYLTVTARSPDALEESCGQVEQAAAQARLELRRLYGEQDRAFTYTLPLCRGLA